MATTSSASVSKLPPTPSSRTGMGANVYAGGCTFRVWAPHAESVAVIGDFNGWNPSTHPLAQEQHGYWSADIPDAKYRDRYKYAIEHHGTLHKRNDPYAREVTNSNGDSVIIDPTFDWRDGQFQMPPWHELVIYEMHIGTFHDQPDARPGNFDRAIEKLDYLANELCVNAIEIMPTAEFPGGFSWGYNPAHQFAVEQDYGGPKALRRFIQAAHARGLAVIMDVVYNHLGPSDNDLWRFDGWSAPGHNGGIYIYDDHRAPTPWGNTRPDYGRGEVRQFLRDNALYWLEEFRVDGLRLDATAYVRMVHGPGSEEIPAGWGLLQWLNLEVNQRQPWKMMIAEDLQDNAWVTKPTADGGAGFDAQWAAGFVHPVRHAIITQDDRDRDLYAVRNAILQRYNHHPLERIIYTESHDEVANGKARVPEMIWPGNADGWHAKKRSTLGAALVMTAPGVPMIFQGQEFLEDRWFTDTEPLDWSRRERLAGIVHLHRDLIRLRRNWFGNTRGLSGEHTNVFHVNNRDKVLAMHRWAAGGAGDDVVVVFNFSSRMLDGYRIGFPREGRWHLRLNSDAQVYDEHFGSATVFDTRADGGPQDGLDFSAKVTLPPYTALIFSQ